MSLHTLVVKEYAKVVDELISGARVIVSIMMSMAIPADQDIVVTQSHATRP